MPVRTEASRTSLAPFTSLEFEAHGQLIMMLREVINSTTAITLSVTGGTAKISDLFASTQTIFLSSVRALLQHFTWLEHFSSGTHPD